MPPQFSFNFLRNIKSRFEKALPVKEITDEQPLRAELFSIDQLELHAKFLAGKHVVSFKKGRGKLLSRLQENEAILLQANELLNDAEKAKRNISPAGEWLLDNYYLIEEQIRLAQEFLPKGYSRELPNLIKGPLAGFPRVYDIAMEMVSHGDGRLDIKGVSGFVLAYQTVKSLKLGELWAIPIMLRLALIENLRRVSGRMILSQNSRDRASYYAGRILEVSAKDTNNVVLEIALMSKEELPLTGSFVAEFVRRLHGQSSALNLPLIWLEKKLSEQGETINRLIQSVSQKQASDQVSIANTIESLRLLQGTNWHDFVEKVSVVEAILKQDPSGDYGGMSFDTRDSYRHVIEKLSNNSSFAEEEVASKVVSFARKAMELKGVDDVTAHIGYYLMDKGLGGFYDSLGLKLPMSAYPQAKKTLIPMIVYTGFIILLTLFFSALALLMAWRGGLRQWLWFVLPGLPLLFTASQAAVSIVNWAATIIVKPKNLSRMDFSEGVPKHAHTLVVIPAMLSGVHVVESLIENIEISYLANVDANVDFALLTDFHDAIHENMPEDGALLAQAAAGIERLNYKYRRTADNVFYLFHRSRIWNEKENTWMCHERKRGKLSDLNLLLRGKGQDRFSLITGDPSFLQDVKYVITLDTDTRMPRNAARDLAAVISHPLNRPYYDELKKRVTSGYGILQPRVEASYPGENPTLFVRVFGGETGIDPYTRAVSDVYQDLFNEGSFIGKGLYDVDAFGKCLKDRLPENLILSHDMLEGCYMRSALVSDVQLHEMYPTGYLKDMNRRRRWIRGDWQISRWMFSKVPGLRQKETNPISFLSKWKIADNLRRSLVPVSTVFLFLYGWIMFTHSWFWTLLLMAFTGLTMPFRSMVEIIKKPRGISVRSHLSSAFSSVIVQALQLCLTFAFMLYEAYVSLGAVTVTLWRLYFSRRHLLEWNSSTGPETRVRDTILNSYKKMFIVPLAGIVCLFSAGAVFDPFALLLLGAWFVSPALAWFMGRPTVSSDAGLSGSRIIFLRKLARRTWNYFETFVTALDNWLPPDNFQEEPYGGAARRTSPTNMGLSLLSTLTAYDFGYISMGKMLNRTRDSLVTMNSLGKFKGHFYNWYSTESLKPLEPLYVSSVDSGNLIGHLLVLRSGLLEMRGEKIVSRKLFDGISDAADVLYESLMETEKGRIEFEKTADKIRRLKEMASFPPEHISGMYVLLLGFLPEITAILTELGREGFEKTRKWALAVEKQCADHLYEMTYMAPWILLAPEIPGMWDNGADDIKRRLHFIKDALRSLDDIPTLGEAARLEQKFLPVIDKIIEELDPASGEVLRIKEWFVQLKNIVKNGATRASERIRAIDDAAILCGEMSVVDYEFLYSKTAHLMTIGYNVGEHKADPACYDLLASEARMCSFVAIAQGRMPQESWFKLGRLLSGHGGDPVLVSWGGSMFEYLMPLLVMPTYKGTLLDKTYKAIIVRQIDYGKCNNIPWGISESGYNKINIDMAYQYRSFGVPDTGFKRGLSEDLVVAPYASVMALMVEPSAACANLEQLSGAGFSGEYGFYEAIDYTPSRLAPDENLAVVRSFMAHHQGMSLLSYAYVLLGKPMQRRFLADPMFKATELLLQERIPDDVPFLYDMEITGQLRKVEEREALLRVFTSPDTQSPEIHLLSNGRYSLMVTNAGGGYSRWKNLAVTRWREDAALDNEGSFIYIRDIKTGDFWSTAYQPSLKKPKNYEAVFSRSRAEFKRSDHRIETHTEIAVSPEDDIELRRVTLTNRSHRRRFIELTSYAEAVLNYPDADRAHTTFSNLFVETEIIRPKQAIICKRRPRSEKEVFPLMLHLMAVHGKSIMDASYETDRAKFIGRCNTLADPDAMRNNGLLSGSEGPVLDPIVSIRCTLELEPDESATVDFVTGICADRNAAQGIMEKYRDRNLADRVFDLAWTHGQVALQQINATETDAQLYGRLAGAIIYANPAWRANASVLRRNFRGQSDLWGYSISGDLPIVLARIEDSENISLIENIVKAHSYWQMNGLAVDLVIWNEDFSVYRDEMGEKINGLISENAGGPSNRPGGIFLRRADQMSEEDKVLIQTVARLIVTDRGGTLSEQADCIAQPITRRPGFVPARKIWLGKQDEGQPERRDLSYFNGLGGFTRDGREYVITTDRAKTTPAPWVNVLANRNFGTVISESGSAYTWSENAHEFRLTPWKNDPVTDACGEAMYIRDEETGRFWSPTPLPAKGETRYVSRHGFGYSIFEHVENGIVSELTVFVSLEHSVKFSILKFRNISGRKRRLSITTYNELVMGTQREKYHMHIVTEVDPKNGAMLAYNHFNKEFPGRVVFLDSSEPARFVCGDRNEFIGRNGTMASPAAMHRDRLSGKTGAGPDPCVCMQVKFELGDGDEKEVVFTFGSGKSLDDARGILQRFNGAASARMELEDVWEYWKRSLGVIYVETPDDSLNFLVNGWLQYQTISCRLWGRSGFYQSGGAYGFRDQLQDVMSMMHSHPSIVREQLTTFAAHQYVEGDVQHWWHPPSGRGVRSNCSDDYLWLAFVTCRYVEEIGDTGILDESVQYLDGPLLKKDEESYYDMPGISGKSGTLYEHCVAAVNRGIKFGIHGLPLMGSGDWNDGMNLVGIQGKGESVWLAFFLHRVLIEMSRLSARRGDKVFSGFCITEAAKLARNIESHAWDGQWYTRAYFDGGEVLGSSSNTECRIDSIPQSWAVISGAADGERARTAMGMVDQMLVDRKTSIIKIFEPPFDRSGNDPGYIKGYVPGVRENGGQYTHAAVWAVMAFAMLKDRKKAWELLDIINPVRHGDTPEKCGVYKVEPYVMAGDVYSVLSNAGRGGWTWYTGSASWMHQLIIRNLLGIRLEVDRLYFEPCLPEEWNSFKVHYRYRETFYHINVQRSGAQDNIVSVTVDGEKQQDKCIRLIDDRSEHAAEVIIG